jgi:hypothetical protein
MLSGSFWHCPSWRFLFSFAFLSCGTGRQGTFANLVAGGTRMFAETFRSPVSKLLAFFRRSRDRWKEKCKQAKKELKSLKTCHAKLRASRDYWKQKARQVASVATRCEPPKAGPIKTPDPACGVAGARRRRNTSGTAAAGGRRIGYAGASPSL